MVHKCLNIVVLTTLIFDSGTNDYTRVFTDALKLQYFDPDTIGNFTEMTPALVDVSLHSF
jgi:hypothetical protein